MNIENLKANGIDYEEGLDRFSGNAKLYEKYLKRLLDLTLYQDMKQAIYDEDMETAFECAHKLKAFIGNLSIPLFFEEIKDLTEKLRGREKGDYQAEFDRLDKMYETILQAVRGDNDV